jgi:2-polyprenyl-3-methyl-5-hydroxy-6-metoxy-1,4-benzoquinol methylase
MAVYKDYGWNNAELDISHSYLLPAIVLFLKNDRSKTILDIGCGNGAIANYLINDGFNVYGIDASVTGIEQANKINKGHFFVQDLSSDNIPSELNAIQFDTIISTEVIEHVYSPQQYIEYCKRVLKNSKTGTLIISTPYHGYLKNLVMALTNNFDKHFTALWEGGHIKFWSRKTLTNLLLKNGLNNSQFKGVGRVPYIWKSMIIKAELNN